MSQVLRKCCGLKGYNEVNNLISHSWIREFDGILSIHTLVKETIQIELLEQGRETTKYLKNKSILEELYISDVDLILSNQYLDFYGETNRNDILMRTEEVCIDNDRYQESLL